MRNIYLIAGQFIKHAADGMIPVRYTTREWERLNLLPSYGMIANQGYSFYSGPWKEVGPFRIILQRRAFRNDKDPISA